MGSQATLDKMTLRQNYRNLWHTDLMSAISADPSYCCLSVWFSPCVSYMLRKRALYGDMSRYTCCGGYMPCSGKCGESKCPEFCLGTEVCLCFGSSVASTRFMLQDEFNIQTTQCDNCIIGFMFCLQQLACIFSIVAILTGVDEFTEASQLLSCLSDLVYCSVCACMQTQHKVELDKRDGKIPSAPFMTVPPVQQMSRLDQPVPPPAVGYPQSHSSTAVGYSQSPPPPLSGYPQPPPPVSSGYSQPLPPGYPPPGYPPPGYPQPTPTVGYPQSPRPPASGYPQPPPPASGYPHPPSPPPAVGYPQSPPSPASGYRHPPSPPAVVGYPQSPPSPASGYRHPPSPPALVGYPQSPPSSAGYHQPTPPPPAEGYTQSPPPAEGYTQSPPPAVGYPQPPPPASGHPQQPPPASGYPQPPPPSSGYPQPPPPASRYPQPPPSYSYGQPSGYYPPPSLS